MHTLEIRRPSRALAAFVSVYAERAVTGTPAVQQLLPARLEPTIEFDLRVPAQLVFPGAPPIDVAPCAVVGPQTMFPGRMRLRGGVRAFGVFFTPGGFTRLFRVPLAEICNRGYDAHGVLGAELPSLWQAVAEAPHVDARVAIVERWLLRKAGETDSARSAVSLVDLIARHRGTLAPMALAHGLGVGQRHLERMFRRESGVTVKRFSRVARFQMALDAKVLSPRRTWLDVAHACGYHDQMHLVHDFHEFAGASPGDTVSLLGDARPPALSRAAADGAVIIQPPSTRRSAR